MVSINIANAKMVSINLANAKNGFNKSSQRKNDKRCVLFMQNNLNTM